MGGYLHQLAGVFDAACRGGNLHRLNHDGVTEIGVGDRSLLRWGRRRRRRGRTGPQPLDLGGRDELRRVLLVGVVRCRRGRRRRGAGSQSFRRGRRHELGGILLLFGFSFGHAFRRRCRRTSRGAGPQSFQLCGRHKLRGVRLSEALRRRRSGRCHAAPQAFEIGRRHELRRILLRNVFRLRGAFGRRRRRATFEREPRAQPNGCAHWNDLARNATAADPHPCRSAEVRHEESAGHDFDLGTAARDVPFLDDNRTVLAAADAGLATVDDELLAALNRFAAFDHPQDEGGSGQERIDVDRRAADNHRRGVEGGGGKRGDFLEAFKDRRPDPHALTGADDNVGDPTRIDPHAVSAAKVDDSDALRRELEPGMAT